MRLPCKRTEGVHGIDIDPDQYPKADVAGGINSGSTALGTIHPKGREEGILSEPMWLCRNLSPTRVRKNYELYDNKICTGDEAAECRFCLDRRMKGMAMSLREQRRSSSESNRQNRWADYYRRKATVLTE
jgi:hypothetical protein